MDVEARRAIKFYSKEARLPRHLLFFEINANVVTKEKEKKWRNKRRRKKEKEGGKNNVFI